MELSNFSTAFGAAEVILAVALTILVLLQAKGSNLGGLLGGGDAGGSFRTRRGVELTMYRITIICGVLFFLNTLVAFLAMG